MHSVVLWAIHLNSLGGFSFSFYGIGEVTQGLLCSAFHRDTLMELKAQAVKPVKAQGYLKLFGWLYWGLMGGFTYGQKAVERMENIVAQSKRVGPLGYFAANDSTLVPRT